MEWVMVLAGLFSGVPVLALGIGGTAAILGGALALGIRHGIDWDHIAAITDITSTSATVVEPDQRLTVEPGVQLTDESHHRIAHMEAETAPRARSAARAARLQPAAVGAGAGAPAGAGTVTLARPGWGHFVAEQRRALVLGTTYALGHGSVVVMLGLLAILASEILPDWVDPLMERVVGVTLLFLAAYLFYSLYRFFRGGEEFRIRSRWMLVFAVVGNGWRRVTAKLHGRHEHHHVEAAQQYGVRTAFGVGMIHGIGAETGTQVLIVATAVGAGSKAISVITLLVFVVGILISNSVITIATATGFVSARRQQWIYVIVGAVAAVFSLIVGLVFLLRATDILPSLDPYFRWIGGPSGN